jgi:hypothetical protein
MREREELRSEGNLMDNYESALTTDAPEPGSEKLTEVVEELAVSMPSSTYLAAALGALAVALAFQATGRSRWASLIAQSVPAWLLIGAYRKVAKIETLRSGRSRGYTS